jgi:glycosyltransferase involved in cell wall biosynthesis
LVVFVQRAVLEYRVTFYELLREALAERGIELAVVRSAPRHGYDRADDAELAWMVDRPARALRWRGREILWQPIGPEVRAADLVIVEQAARLISNLALLAYPGPPQVALWGHGRTLDPMAGSLRAGHWVKQHLFPLPHWWFAYNELAADIVRDTGFPLLRMTVVENSTDTRQLRQSVRRITAQQRSRFREQHDLGDGPVALFLGNLSARKRPEFLLSAADDLADRVDGFRLILVGDGELRVSLQDAAHGRDYLRLLDHRAGEALAEVLAVSRVLLVPSWAGLVVVDSFAGGVPLCASLSMDHPPEISYIEHGTSGLLIDDGGDPGRYAATVAEVLLDDDLHERLVAGCAVAAERYTVEGMVERFADGIQSALACPPISRRFTGARAARGDAPPAEASTRPG